MARKLKDRITTLEDRVAKLAKAIKGNRASGLKKVKRQIRRLTDDSKRMKRDVKRAKTGA